MFDRLFALSLLICLSPFLFIILIISWIDTGAFPIFIQKRTVNGKNVFDFYKVRSMHFTAPIVPTNEFKNPDKYISIWGSFIRRYSLDELLNLVSVVKGDMILIGPRPIILDEKNLIESRYKHGIKSKPGLTGLAQVKGRDNISFKNKILYEKYFQINNSWRLRLYILIKTFIIIIRSDGISH